MSVCVHNMYFPEREKNNKTFCRKSFSVFRGVNGTPPKTLKLFGSNVLLIYLTNHEDKEKNMSIYIFL